MKLLGIYLHDYQQFKNFELDFTYPADHEKAGQPLEKICFIGRNGTGKSTLLNTIQWHLNDLFGNYTISMILKFGLRGKNYYAVKSLPGFRFFLKESVDSLQNWKQIFYEKYKHNPIQFTSDYPEFCLPDTDPELTNYAAFLPNSGDLMIHVPSEGSQNIYKEVKDVPQTTLNDALKLFDSFPASHSISTDSVKNFWNVLTYQVKKRENDLREFQNSDSNLDKTVREVQDIFEKKNPQILDQIAIIWNSILGKANLEFDSKGARNPVQLTDNLKAYIRLKSNGKRINYNELSSGIRNFIFKLGHIYSLYFNREIEKGFLLIDEPENNLYPDFLYGLIETYLNIIKNTQFFVATHSPIIAAQFQPYERFILDFNEDGTVFCRKGETPIGDDPNDLLIKDFNIHSLLGKEGIEKWERYIELKLTIPGITDKTEKSRLLDEFIKIGNEYNFSPDEVSQ